jgi:hypothetical protein
MRMYLVVSSLPYQDVEDTPGIQFATGTGFEDPKSQFLVVGPFFTPKDLKEVNEWLEIYLNDGYEVKIMSTPIR